MSKNTEAIIYLILFLNFKFDVVCTYIEYLLYQEYMKQTHCYTLLQCLHKQRPGQNLSGRNMSQSARSQKV